VSISGHEEEFRRLFEQEATTRLTQLADAAMAMERGAGEELVDAMFRDAHTLKGGAGIVGFREIADVVHELEQLLHELREGRREPTPALGESVLHTVDALRDMVRAAMTGGDQTPAADAARTAIARADDPGGPAPGGGQGGPAALAAAPLPARRLPARAAAAPSASPRESIPVPVGRLDELVRLVGESAAAQLRVGRLISDRLGDEPDVLDEYRELARALQELQEKAMRTRMVSVGTIAGPLARAVRDLARSSGKQVHWELVGEATELDRHVLEHLREPLVALVRNAVDHGLELPDERVAAGKDPAGTVRVDAMQLGGEVVISVSDDGRGVDLAGVRDAAALDEDEEDADALAAIFEPGVSTARTVTEVSGRGVGLDAVRAAVELLRGRVEVHSSQGAGSEFRISVPMTLAVLRCLLVRAGRHRYALPLHATATVVPPTGERLTSAEGRPAVWVGGEAVAMTDLTALLDGGAGHALGPAIVISTAVGRHALRVDELIGQRDVVVKDLGRLLPRLDLLAGASVEPDGTIMLVLDAAGLIAAARRGVAAGGDDGEPPLLVPGRRGRILVVDDALTIRELQRSILERAGYEVVTAAGGQEALELLAEEPADLVLTDVEMPGMDGFVLTEIIRGSPRHGALPVLILTSRTDEDDRRRGLEAGADAYLVKATFDEHALLTAIAGLLGERRALPPGDDA
jgi:two-component system chemotaxis sensor kinase CheA